MLVKYLSIFFLSMLPVAELRLAVPVAIGMGIDHIPAIIICACGNILPIPFVYFFARKFLAWGANKRCIGRICTFCLTKGERAGQMLVARTGRYGLFMALLLFVGIPLPGTGAWTGALAASCLNMGIRTTSLSVCLGVILAGCIMAVASTGVFHMIGLS